MEEVRVDALEDAVYEKALTSAASDATARRKIEEADERRALGSLLEGDLGGRATQAQAQRASRGNTA